MSVARGISSWSRHDLVPKIKTAVEQQEFGIPKRPALSVASDWPPVQLESHPSRRPSLALYFRLRAYYHYADERKELPIFIVRRFAPARPSAVDVPAGEYSTVSCFRTPIIRVVTDQEVPE